jgi:hypothetical protein
MKRFIPLMALFAAGVAASYAFASPPRGPGSSSSSSTSTSAHGNSGTHGNAKCHPVNFKGTVTGGTIMVTDISHISGPAKNLTLGGVASLTVNGKVSVQAWDCGSPGAAPTQQTLVLRQLRIGGSPHVSKTGP